jgi:GNAT superfamily N-acetyltransferase
MLSAGEHRPPFRCGDQVAESRVRRADAGDAATIAGLQIQVWQQVFSEILPTEIVLTDAVAHTAIWAARLSHGGAVLLATEGAEPVGFAAVAAERDADRAGEIEVLYVVPRWGRRGHGGRLLAGAADALRRLGAASGRWWIPQTDTASARFATAAGWAADGAHRAFDTGGGRLVEVRYSGGIDLVAA